MLYLLKKLLHPNKSGCTRPVVVVVFLLLMLSSSASTSISTSGSAKEEVVVAGAAAASSASASTKDDSSGSGGSPSGAMTVRKSRATGWFWSSDSPSSNSTSSSPAVNEGDFPGDVGLGPAGPLDPATPPNGKQQQNLQQQQSRSQKQVQDAELLEPRGYFTFLAFSTSPIPPGPVVTTTTTTTPAPTTLSNNCICVPYYYCDEGQVVSDGSGVIDIRNGWPCRSILEVCCRNPRATPAPVTAVPAPGPTTVTPPPVAVTAIPGFSPRCGTLNPNGINARILGFKDSETQFGEYPWMAAVLQTKYFQGKWVYQFLCGASLIWPSVVVTAAHCVKGKIADHLKIRLGEWDTQTTNEFYPYQDIRGKEIVIHPNYWGGGLYNDIALIFLSQPAILSPHIDTICLPAAVPQYENSSCWATGWGKDAFGSSGSYQVIMREVELPLTPTSFCQTALRQTNLGPGFNLHSNFLCAGGLKGLDTCVGDGGGPLVCPSRIDPWRYELSGITSWGVGCGTYGVPGVYVDVSKFRNWIDNTILVRIPTYDVTRVIISAPSTRDQQYG